MRKEGEGEGGEGGLDNTGGLGAWRRIKGQQMKGGGALWQPDEGDTVNRRAARTRAEHQPRHQPGVSLIGG